MQNVTHNVTQSSFVSADISKDIAEVRMAAEENASTSSQVHLSAEQLSNVSEKLKDMISRFKLRDA